MRTKELILTAMFTTLTAVGAFIKIPIGPVPITLQFLFTALAGILLGPKLGALSQLIYVILGLIGVPVFTGGGGLSYIFYPTFGYLIGFIIAPLLIGKFTLHTNKPSFLRIFIGCLISILTIYIIGVPYMYLILNYVNHTAITVPKAIISGFLVFLPGDILKSLIAAYLGTRLLPILKKFTYSEV